MAVEEKPPRRPRQSTARTQRQRQAPAPSPTRSITPGREHTKVAEAILKKAQREAAKRGIDLDVGEFPTYTGSEAGEPDDPQKPVRILSHAVARAADRLGVTRKISRHLEGRESRSGLGSDVLAELHALYERNRDLVDDLALSYLMGVRERIAERQAQAAHQPQSRSRFRRRKNAEAEPPAQTPTEGSF